MRWIITVECIGDDDEKSTITLGTIGRAADSTVTENVGVNLRESKKVLPHLQETVVGQQLQEHCEQKRKCPNCSARHTVKHSRHRCLDTVLGTVRVEAPRYQPCCCRSGSGISIPISELLPERTTPELLHLQGTLGAQISYPRWPPCRGNFWRQRAERLTP